MVLSNLNNKKQCIFDPLRHIWVKATPEEHVRQVLLRRMVNQLGYPRELIAVEKKLEELVIERDLLIAQQIPYRRIDVICFKKNRENGLQPLLLIECKDLPFTQKAIDQVIGYNAWIQAPFLSVISSSQEMIGQWDPGSERYRFQRGFPSYLELLDCATLGVQL